MLDDTKISDSILLALEKVKEQINEHTSTLIKESQTFILKQIDEKILAVSKSVQSLEFKVYGNGEKGLIRDMDDMKRFNKIIAWAGMIVISIVLSIFTIDLVQLLKQHSVEPSKVTNVASN